MRLNRVRSNVILPAMKRKPIQVHRFTLRDEHIELHNLLKIVGVADSGGTGQGAGRCGYSASGRCAGIAQDGQDPRRAKVTLNGVTIHVHA